LLCGLLVPAYTSADIVFETITDDAFIGRSGGADGFVGTADDGVDFSNVLGAVSWGVSPPGFVTYIAPLTLTLPDPLVFEDGSSTITDFSADGLTTCPPCVFDFFAANDLPAVTPHEIVTALDGRQEWRFTTGVCAGLLTPCTEGNSVALVELDGAPGFLLLRGTDPADLPGIDPALAAYLDFLSGVVRPDWTAIIVNHDAAIPGGFFLVTADPVNRLAIQAIDIKPGSDPNPINPFAQGTIPVAILSSDSFDATAVDVTTLTFGPAGAAPAHPPGGHFQDVNDDGLTDLLSHYRTQETGIAMGDTEACVVGETLGGIPIEGCDAIATQTPSRRCGLGFELTLILPGLMWLHRRRRRRF
jgi:hypothetical protein